MSKKVLGGSEFVSPIHLRYRRFIFTAVQVTASSKSRCGRPTATDAARRTSWGYAATGTVQKQCIIYQDVSNCPGNMMIKLPMI